MKYTESQIKNIGGKRFFKARSKRIFLSYVLSIGWIPVVYWLITSPKLWIVLAPVALVTLNILWSWNQSRNMFYARVKKNPELLD